MHFLLYKKRSAKGTNGLGDHCLAPTVVKRRAHAFAEENVAYSDAKAAACRKRHALFHFVDTRVHRYRVKAKRGVEFRKWANSVLKQYILQGYAVNNNRIAQLGEVI